MSKNEVFVDTAYLIAITRQDDQWHGAAVEALRRPDRVSFVTTDEVLTEFLTALSRGSPHLRAEAVMRVREVLEASDTRVVPQSRQSFIDGLARYEQRLDKAYSLQDCIAMNVMEAEGITEILTSDHNFEQEGFTILMKPGR